MVFFGQTMPIFQIHKLTTIIIDQLSNRQILFPFSYLLINKQQLINHGCWMLEVERACNALINSCNFPAYKFVQNTRIIIIQHENYAHLNVLGNKSIDHFNEH